MSTPPIRPGERAVRAVWLTRGFFTHKQGGKTPAPTACRRCSRCAGVRPYVCKLKRCWKHKMMKRNQRRAGKKEVAHLTSRNLQEPELCRMHRTQWFSASQKNQGSCTTRLVGE
eukprot:1153728-Pelagomonas_calceolata.AAC.5